MYIYYIIMRVIYLWLPVAGALHNLVSVGHSYASYITKHWLDNVLSMRVKNLYDLPNVSQINALESYIQDNRQSNDYYMAWMPQNHICFIAVCQEKEGFKLRQLVSSPDWTPEEVPSLELKHALETSFPGIKMDDFYKYDPRYQLAWSTWELETNEL
ncbi:MAG: hypothetical protein ACO3UU_15595 [Minisyncoccia bacterium]